MEISEWCSELNASSEVLVLIIWILSNQIQVAQLSLTNVIRCWVFYFCWSAEHINVQYFRVNWPAGLFCPQEKFCWNKIYWQIVRTTFCNTIVMRTILTSSFCRGLWIFRKRNCWFDLLPELSSLFRQSANLSLLQSRSKEQAYSWVMIEESCNKMV